jgi:diacylglycerol kinase (ATP)
MERIMEYENYHFIINPTSGGGSAGRIWGQTKNYLESRLGKFSYEFTTSKGSGIDLAKRASDKEVPRIVCIGGDGSISEIITGLMNSERKSSTLSVLNLGTGGDFCRTLKVSTDIKEGLNQLMNGTEKYMDLGRISFSTNNSKNETRFFVNIAGCGMAGEVVKTINKSSKSFGSFSYYLSSVKKLFSYKNKLVKIKMDNNDEMESKIVTIAISNGKYFGGGMKIAPDAMIDDGKFHVTIIEDWSILQKIIYSSKLYNGSILKTKGVKSFVCEKIKIESLDENPALIDCDGEDIGFLPLEAEVIPSAIKFIV